MPRGTLHRRWVSRLRSTRTEMKVRPEKIACGHRNLVIPDLIRGPAWSEISNIAAKKAGPRVKPGMTKRRNGSLRPTTPFGVSGYKSNVMHFRSDWLGFEPGMASHIVSNAGVPKAASACIFMHFVNGSVPPGIGTTLYCAHARLAFANAVLSDWRTFSQGYRSDRFLSRSLLALSPQLATAKATKIRTEKPGRIIR